MFTDPRKDKRVLSYLCELCSNRGTVGLIQQKGRSVTHCWYCFWCPFTSAMSSCTQTFPSTGRVTQNVLHVTLCDKAAILMLKLFKIWCIRLVQMLDLNSIYHDTSLAIKVWFFIQFSSLVVSFSTYRSLRWQSTGFYSLFNVSVNIWGQLDKCGTRSADLGVQQKNNVTFSLLWFNYETFHCGDVCALCVI